MRIAVLLIISGFILTGCGGTVAKTEGAGETMVEQASEQTAEDVLAAFEEQGLLVPEPRDNSAWCVELKCEALITTSTVSIYEWKSTKRASRVFSEGEFGDYQSGKFILFAHGDEIDITAYARVLNETVS